MNDAHEQQERGCGWLVEGWPDDAPEDWYPDSPSDLIRECGAPVTELSNGWRCAGGHSHFNDVEYFDDDEIAGCRMFPASAVNMRGVPIA